MTNRFVTGIIPAVVTGVTVFTYLRIWGDSSWMSYAGLLIAGGFGAAFGLAINRILFRNF